MLVGQDALCHNPSVVAVESKLADALVDEVLGPLDPTRLVDVDGSVAERPVGEYGDGDERRRTVGEGSEIVGPTQLRHIIGAATDHAFEDLRHDSRCVEAGVHSRDQHLLVAVLS
jgi:hypothetical protein